MYDEMKRHEIAVLHGAGLSVRQVAKKARVSRNTVRKILRDSGVDPERRPVGRPPVATPFEAAVRAILVENWDLPSVEVLRRLRERGYPGGKNPIYQMVRRLRPIITPPMVRFEGLAGEFSQNDFGSIRVGYDDGTTETPHFFASRLKWSRWVHVEVVPDEKVEALVRALLASFAAFGGVPLCCVFDNPKTVVISPYGDQIQWNETFAQVALDYRFVAELCTPRRGQEKGAVENLVGFVKKNFFLVRRFHDRADLETQLGQWNHEVNEVRPCRATGVTPLARMAEERARLRPLPFRPSEYALRFPVRVGPTGWVLFRGVRYSMPAEAIGVSGTLYLYRDRVRIMTDRYDVAHPRTPLNGVSTLPHHATSALAAVSGRRAQLYYKRQRLFEVGPVAEAFLTELVHARPNTWAVDVHRLFELLLEHGAERMAEAFQHALDRGWHSAELVELALAPSRKMGVTA
ncbi:Integrase, catalytic region [mine drainage metagenome]|uniref:Integrase, catalytic region n=1 Tax=mine drainage metagenome TaxID=410659 RepID=T1D796_9ZZZZ